MNLDFLTNLPKSNLDDRTQRELVEEALLRIPRYCPEWTHYNASDPGVTLVELFASITEQMLARFNQVPRRNYVTFLELLGVRLSPPVPAQTDLTFYLNTALDEPYIISEGIEVATVRTELEEAVVFTTDSPLTIGVPIIRHLLTANEQEQIPQVLQDRLTNYWTRSPDGDWFGPEQPLFAPRPNPGNCIYVVLEPTADIAGNVIALNVTGTAAATTGIDPNRPPLRWEAWDGAQWVPVLRGDEDDNTQGFSFHRLSQRPSVSPTADVTLHLPSRFPPETFSTYHGCWLRCVCLAPTAVRPAYSQSPLIRGLSLRGIGGTVRASQCKVVRNEQLGLSDGTAGQTFQLFGVPVLPRQAHECLQVTPPDGLPVIWTEVPNFANSTAEDLHYVVDSITGTLQFGPLVRESGHLSQAITERRGLQGLSAEGLPLRHLSDQSGAVGVPTQEKQYGKIPPRGASLKMITYRTGGGRQGNVQSDRLQVLKVALPYIAMVTNHSAARHGADAESLEQAAIRVPNLLRNRDRAVTPEDFEFLTLQASRSSVAQCRCLPATDKQGGGSVRVLVVPKTGTEGIENGAGMHPDCFQLRPGLQQEIYQYLDARKLLGTQIEIDVPDYVGVSVRAEVGLETAYNNLQAREAILKSLRLALYRFLNPLVGGFNGRGWPFGQSVHDSDVVGVLRQIEGVSYIGVLQLFELRFHQQRWVRKPAENRQVNPGPTGLICSWRDRALRSNHTINAIY